ncbi:MAG: porin [Holosporales bacterium]|jgi:hypothetical protein|nr:porin [Holosporales bacterium]
MFKCSLLSYCALFVIFSCHAEEHSHAEAQDDKGEKEKDAKEKQEGIVLRAEKDGMPDFNIFGAATVSLNHVSSNITYYNGENKPDQIKTDQKSTSETSKDSTKMRIVGGCTDIGFSAKGSLPNGWAYGATISLDAERGNTGVDRMYLSAERNNVGTFHVGNVRGADSVFAFDGQRLMGGLCGADGSFPFDLDYSTGVISPCYVIGFTNKATKASYFTPTIMGFQAGISITPDTKHIGTMAKDSGSGDSTPGNDPGLFIKGDNDKERPSGRNNIAFGFSHAWDFNNGWKTNFGAIFVTEDSKPIETNCYVGEIVGKKDAVGKDGDANYQKEVEASAPVARKIKLRNAGAFHLSGTVTYKDWSFGAGFINNGKSRLPTGEMYTDGGKDVIPGGFLVAKDGNAGHAWNIGTKYVFEQWTFAAVFHKTSRKVTANQKANSTILSFSAEYQFCPGLKVFCELDNIVTHSCDYACAVYNLVHAKKDAIQKQSAFFVAVGAKVTF